MASKPRLLVSRRMMPANEERLAAEFDATIIGDSHVMTSDEIVAEAEGKDALLICVSERIDADVINRLPDSVQAIMTLSIGLEHIDLDAAKARGIAVMATPDAVTDPTVEIAMYLLLGAARRTTEAVIAMREGGWGAWTPRFMVGTDVTGGTLGIFGMGRIGRTLAKRARAFDMKINYHNRTRLGFEEEAGASYYTMAEGLLEVSPFLAITAPSTPETRQFLNAERISQLPDGAIVVNVSRGDLVDDDALIEALKSGKVAAAGLDVFNGEPYNFRREYLELPNVCVTPHIGSAAVKARAAMGDMLLDGLLKLRAGEPVPNRVV